MKQLTITVLMILLSFSYAHSVEIEVDGKYTTRARQDDTRKRVQEQLKFNIGAKINDNDKLKALIRNGTSFNSGYDTFYDSSKEDEFDGGENIIKNLAINHFYFERKQSKDITLQVGALPTEKGLTSITALDSNGWVDGARIKLKTEYGDIRVTTGSITDLDEINFFQRSKKLNYFEVNVSKEVYDNINVEFGFERLDDENFLTLAHKQKLAFASDKIIQLVSEALLNLDEEAMKASFGFVVDPVHLFADRKSDIKIEIRTNYRDPDVGVRGTELNSGSRNSEGHYATVGAKFNISKKHNVSGELRFRVNYDSDEGDERIDFTIQKKTKHSF